MTRSDIYVGLVFLMIILSTLLLSNRQSGELQSIRARLTLLESQVGHGNTPQINVMGRTSIYSTEREIVIQDMPKEGD